MTIKIQDRVEQSFRDEAIRELLIRHEVAFAYLFGSHARNTASGASDIDVAVYMLEETPRKRFEYRLSLIGKLSSALRTEVEVVVLNDTRSNYLLFDIMRDGKVIFERSDDSRFLYETETLHRISDFLNHVEHVSSHPHHP